MGCNASKDEKKEKPKAENKDKDTKDAKNDKAPLVETAPSGQAAPGKAPSNETVSEKQAVPQSRVEEKREVVSRDNAAAAAVPSLATQSPNPSVRRSSRKQPRDSSAGASRKSMSRASTSVIDGPSRSASKRFPRTSAEYFEGALPRYPTAMRARMQETRNEVAAIPEDATPYIGMELSETNEGLAIESVSEGGPAHIIGIVPGDILTGIGATAITPTTRLAHLADVVKETCRVGRVVPVRFSQNGVEVEAPLWIMTTDADLADRPYFFNPLVNRVVARRRSTVRVA